ncbi:GAF domain-containing sensor histidine kinase [Streptosporangium longisporum]|uniref:Oxygen sensor histidine kinase NreB n=1 Tax=Streptosporangium longisporum TaxID=46187 RepID=A0ABP6KEB7_9ACTN
MSSESEDPGAVLHAVSSAVLAVTRHLSVREVLQVIVRSAQRLLDARYAALGVPDEAGAFAEFVAEGISDEEWEAIGPMPRQHGMLGAMLREGAPVRLPDIRRDPRFECWPRAHPVLKDFLGVPILDGDQVLGIIFLSNKRGPGGFTEADQRLLTMFAAHAAIALTNARLYERSRELALVEERTRMARELHDAVTQKLFSLRLTAQAAASLVPGDPVRALRELDRVERLAGEALAELRAVIVELRPAELGRHGLAETLRKHVRLLDRLHPASFSFSSSPSDGETGGESGAETGAETGGEAPGADGGTRALDPAVEVAVLRVAQEALHNASRHSAARTVAVRLGREDGRVVLEVSDDGAGFDVATAAGRGLGIASMADRAEAVGGSVLVRSELGAGTVIRMEVPG